jgi:VIT1/CCC1 family predicted Fe2+/Mn2+ transporter
VTPERMAGLVSRWVRLYTRDLPAAVARRRREEIDADLHDHIVHERAGGTGDRRIALAVASRMVRGLAADVAWRAREATQARHSTLEERMKTSNAHYRSAARVALGVALILSLPFVGMLLSDDVAWSLADFVAAGALLTIVGVAIELAVRRAGNRAIAVGLGALGVAAAVFGEADDAPGLVLLGILLVGSGCALGLRAARA